MKKKTQKHSVIYHLHCGGKEHITQKCVAYDVANTGEGGHWAINNRTDGAMGIHRVSGKGWAGSIILLVNVDGNEKHPKLP